jgi:hypothetical protein
MNEVFDYKAELRKTREELWRRIASYALTHRETRIVTIAQLFNITRTTVEIAMGINGLKRKQGRKSYHYPPKDGE